MRSRELKSDSARWWRAGVLCLVGSLVWTAVSEAAPQGGALRLAEARRAIEAGRLEEAEALLEVDVEQWPGSSQAWALLGRARALNRRYRAAEPAGRQAGELGEASM